MLKNLTFATTEVPYLFFSHLNTMESVTETETESNKDNYLAGLIQSMAQSFLQDDNEERNGNGSVESKDSGLAGEATMTVSPQSTICSYLSTSENSSPLLFSTPAEKSKEDKELQEFKAQEINKPTAAAKSVLSNNTVKGPAINKQRQTAQKPQLKPKTAWAVQNKAKIGGVGNCALGLPSSAWPPLKKQPKQKKPQSQPQPKPMLSPEMRALFLSSPGMKRKSVGTGVFIPRMPNTLAEPRRKPACSMVLVPARVVQALNLNLEELDAQPRFTKDGAYAGYVLRHEALLNHNTSIASLSQNSNVPLRPKSPEMPSPYLHLLPQEWTY